MRLDRLVCGAACFCGKSYGRFGKEAESESNTKCAGDAKQTCGGDYHNGVYELSK